MLAALASFAFAKTKTPSNPYIFTEQLHVESADRLKKAFFGGEPWLIYCYDEKFEKDKGFHEAADALNSLGVRTAVLNCFDKLPSGKTTVDRFKLDRRFQPIMFLCANGGKPRQLYPMDFGKSKQARRLNLDPQGYYSQDYVKSDGYYHPPYIPTNGSLLPFKVQSYARPRLLAVTGNSGMQQFCLNRQACNMVVHHGKLTKKERKTLSAIMQGRKGRPKFPRNVAWVAIDTRSYSLSNWPEVNGLKLPGWATRNATGSLECSESKKNQTGNAGCVTTPAVVAFGRMTLPPKAPLALADVVRIKFDRAMHIYQHPRGRRSGSHNTSNASTAAASSSSGDGSGGGGSGGDGITLEEPMVRLSLCRRKFLQHVSDTNGSFTDESNQALVTRLDRTFDENLVSFKQFMRLLPGAEMKKKGKGKTSGRSSKSSKAKSSAKGKSVSSADSSTSGMTGLLAHKELVVELPSGYRYPWHIAQHYLLARRLYNVTFSNRRLNTMLRSSLKSQSAEQAKRYVRQQALKAKKEKVRRQWMGRVHTDDFSQGAVETFLAGASESLSARRVELEEETARVKADLKAGASKGRKKDGKKKMTARAGRKAYGKKANSKYPIVAFRAPPKVRKLKGKAAKARQAKQKKEQAKRRRRQARARAKAGMKESRSMGRGSRGGGGSGGSSGGKRGEGSKKAKVKSKKAKMKVLGEEDQEQAARERERAARERMDEQMRGQIPELADDGESGGWEDDEEGAEDEVEEVISLDEDDAEEQVEDLDEAEGEGEDEGEADSEAEAVEDLEEEQEQEQEQEDDVESEGYVGEGEGAGEGEGEGEEDGVSEESESNDGDGYSDGDGEEGEGEEEEEGFEEGRGEDTIIDLD